MRHRLRQFYAIFSISWREQLRDRILWVGFLLGVLVVAFVISVSRFSFILESRLLLNSGGFFLDASAILLSLMIGSKLYAHDLDTKMFDLIFVRKVHPSSYILGRVLGLSVAVALSNLVLAVIVAGYLHIVGQPEWFGVSLLWLSAALKGAMVSLWVFVITLRFRPFVAGVLGLLGIWIAAQVTGVDSTNNFLIMAFPALTLFDFGKEVLYGAPISFYWIAGGILQIVAWMILWSVIARSLFAFRRSLL